MLNSRRNSRFSIVLTFLVVLIGSIPAAFPVAAATVQAPRVRYVSPTPGARLILPETNIIVRLDRAAGPDVALDPAAIVAVGSLSGTHAGAIRVAEDGRTLLFRPDRGFALGEKVTVRLAPSLMLNASSDGGPAAFSFTIAPVKPLRAPDSVLSEWTAAGAPASARNARAPRLSPFESDSVPPGFPAISSSVFQPPTPGRLFLSSLSFSGPNDPYLLILDDYGSPLFYRRMESSCFDFKVQPDGRLTYCDQGMHQFYAMDDSYAIVDSFTCGNGYYTDLHELRLLPNGHALLMAYDSEPVDMSTVVPGGNPDATVIGLIIQELDENKDVVFQWRSWDHFEITDATHEDLTAASIDYVHGNAIEVDYDGNLLISNRHMDEITKIDRETGAVLWRWGGKHNEFTFLGDTLAFSHQHAIRLLANGHYTLFDNGNFHTPQFSRGVEYELDEVNKTARVVWQYRHTPDIYGLAMGYMQRLDNGNTLISWGAGKPDLVEVTPSGTEVMQMTLPDGIFSYRGFRFLRQSDLSVPLARLPSGVSLSAGEPNPLRDRTQVTLDLNTRARVSLRVYDIGGREVLDALDGAMLEAGKHRISVDLSNRTPGLYFCKLTANDFSGTRKLLLIH